MINYVLGFMFSEDLSQVVLIRKDHPVDQKGLLNGVGGRMMDMESESRAMSREFAEEAGIKTHESEWSPIGSIIGYAPGASENIIDYKVFCFYAKGDVAGVKTMTREPIEVHLYKAVRPPDMPPRGFDMLQRSYEALRTALIKEQATPKPVPKPESNYARP